MDEVNGTGKFISGEDYWKWRLTIEEMNISKLRSEHEKSKVRIKELELTLQKVGMHKAKELEGKAITEYHKFTDELGEELGVNLKDVIIDEHTFEVKHIEKEANNGTGVTS